MTRLLAASLIVLSLSACTKDEVVEETADTSVAELPSWAEMTEGQKTSFMANEVTPAMAAIFKAYDAEKYADFSCETCHGAYAEGSGYEMPSPSNGLAKPPPPVTAGPNAEFMYNEVLPKMAELLDTEVNDGSNDGFSCYGCHGSEGS